MTAYITVLRSTRAPKFDDTPYNVLRIAETTPVGLEIFQVRAHDPDLMVSTAKSIRSELLWLHFLFRKLSAIWFYLEAKPVYYKSILLPIYFVMVILSHIILASCHATFNIIKL